MILIPTPPPIDFEIITKLKHEIVYEMGSSSTLLVTAYQLIPNENLGSLEFIYPFASNLKLDSPNDNFSSTWDDVGLNEFDIHSNLLYRRSYKVRAKVKSISKFVPTVVLD